VDEDLVAGGSLTNISPSRNKKLVFFVFFQSFNNSKSLKDVGPENISS
jgi:hypothetical protein